MDAVLLLTGQEFEQSAIDLLQKHRPDVNVKGIWKAYVPDSANDEIKQWSLRHAAESYARGEIDAFIGANEAEPSANEQLYEIGAYNNYLIPTKYYNKSELNMHEKEDILRPFLERKPELRQLEFQLVDHCNLNCKGCTHFCNLVTEPVYADYEQFCKDLSRLAELFDNIVNFYPMGGEPLLNPDADQYLYAIRDAFPYTNIIFVTNGILLPSAPERFFEAVKETNTLISISNYINLDEKKAIHALKEHGIAKAELRIGKEEFGKFLDPRQGNRDTEDVFNHCPRRFCTFLSKNEIAACTQPFTVKYFNAHFEESFSTGGAISLYEEGVDGFDILSRLGQPMDACRYCTYEELFPWGTAKGDRASKEDWLVSGAYSK